MKRLSLLVLLFLFSACSKVDRLRQARTFADMQTITRKIESLHTEGGTPWCDAAKVQGLIASVANGRDAWGNPLVFVTQAATRGCSYLLISKGSDAKLDVADPREYFHLGPRVSHDQPWLDIVFRDGKAVTLGGK